MKIDTHPKKVLAIFIGLLICSGLVLLYNGFDPVAQAKIRKDGILTAEQVKVAFDSVGGRLIKEGVKEGEHVKKGDVLMVIDSTDIDLSIEKTKAQIAQMDAQIAAQDKSIAIGFAQADTTEVQTFRQIDMQKAAIDSANSTYATKLADFKRMEKLQADGAISKKELDAYRNAMEVAQADVRSTVNGLNQLLGGAYDTGDTDSLVLPAIQNQRAEVANKKNDLASLTQQKKQLEVTLKELLVNKERLVLKAPEDGKILKVIAKEGEMISPNTPVILLESDRTYYDIYLPETEIKNLHEGDALEGRAISNDIKVPGQDIFGNVPGYFGASRDSRKWLITSAKLNGTNKASLDIINDYGSEDLTATLTYDPKQNTYTLRQTGGSRLKIVVSRKWVKIPTEITLVPHERVADMW